MKKCRVCNIEKPINEFGTRLGKPTNRCKPCKYKQNNAWRRKKNSENRLYYVYYLPEEHYVGFTYNIKQRMYEHKNQGKITDGYEVYGGYKHPAAALMVEAYFHLHGYLGCNYE